MAEAKKLSLLRIKQILERFSDAEHPLTQEDVIERLAADYGISMDRKAIARNVSYLQEAGMEIHTGRGYYVEKRTFSDAELRLLIDAVLASHHITEKKTNSLIRRLEGLTSEFFKSHVRHVANVGDFNKTENPALFINMELIDNAINRGRQIRYSYNKYGVDKKLHHSSTSVVSPYQMLLHNQHYYLMGYSEYWGNMIYHRIDRMTDLTVEETKAVPIRSLKGYENGVNYKTISCSMPYMFSDTPEYVELLADNGVVDQIVDWFGSKDVIFQKYSDSQVRARIRVSPMAMEYWALQYLNHVEVLKPETLRVKIRENLKKAAVKYEK